MTDRKPATTTENTATMREVLAYEAGRDERATHLDPDDVRELLARADALDAAGDQALELRMAPMHEASVRLGRLAADMHSWARRMRTFVEERTTREGPGRSQAEDVQP